jgi:hypothetical protein
LRPISNHTAKTSGNSTSGPSAAIRLAERALAAEWVCVPAIRIRSAAMPVSSTIHLRAASPPTRHGPMLSTITIANRAAPPSSTRQRAHSSS